MIQALHNGASGLTKGQRNLDTIAHNLSNVNNNGYKAMRADFADLMARRLTRPLNDPAANGPEFNLQVTVGAKMARASRLMTMGTLIETGRALDFAIQGDGFFVLQTPAGEAYTRDGSFYLSVNPDGTHDVVDANGFYLLDQNGAPITLTGNVSQLAASPEGELYIDGVLQAVLGFVAFENPSSLEAGPNGTLVPSANTGAMEPFAADVRHRALESSNVDYATEMSRMIRAQRAFQMASRIVSVSDQMLGLAASIR